MPELPEVETVCRGLLPVMEGSTITSVRQNRPNLRYPFPADFIAKLTNQKIRNITRRAKYIKIHLEEGGVLIIHLGMSGRMIIDQSDRPDAIHEHVVFNLDNGYNIRYNDPRRFGCMDITEESKVEKHKYFANLGPEPFSVEFNARYLLDKLKTKASPIKTALLDQTIVAGLGNIYVCEALFRTRVSPLRQSKLLIESEAKILISHIREILNRAIAAGGSTLRDHAQPDGKLGYFQHSFEVYGCEGQPCRICKNSISRITQAGRSTFYCSNCQI